MVCKTFKIHDHLTFSSLSPVVTCIYTICIIAMPAQKQTFSFSSLLFCTQHVCNQSNNPPTHVTIHMIFYQTYLCFDVQTWIHEMIVQYLIRNFRCSEIFVVSVKMWFPVQSCLWAQCYWHDCLHGNFEYKDLYQSFYAYKSMGQNIPKMRVYKKFSDNLIHIHN